MVATLTRCRVCVLTRPFVGEQALAYNEAQETAELCWGHWLEARSQIVCTCGHNGSEHRQPPESFCSWDGVNTPGKRCQCNYLHPEAAP